MKSRIKLAELNPDDVEGICGKPLGTQVRLVGNVIDVIDERRFTLRIKPEGEKNSTITCRLMYVSYPPKLPKVGKSVALVGFEMLTQRGFGDSVGNYLMTRVDILSSEHGQNSDPPGGDGKSRFEPVFMVIDIPAVIPEDDDVPVLPNEATK